MAVFQASRPVFNGTNEVQGRSIAVGYTHTFSPRLLNEARFGFILARIKFLPVNGTGNTAIGVGGPGGVNRNNGISLIGGGNGSLVDLLGDGGEFTLRERTYQFSDALTYITGNHTFKFGDSVIRRNIRSFPGSIYQRLLLLLRLHGNPGQYVRRRFHRL